MAADIHFRLRLASSFQRDLTFLTRSGKTLIGKGSVWNAAVLLAASHRDHGDAARLAELAELAAALAAVKALPRAQAGSRRDRSHAMKA